MPEPKQVLMIGNPIDGFYVVGPFDDRDAAQRYIDAEFSAENMYITDLQPPDQGDEDEATDAPAP